MLQTSREAVHYYSDKEYVLATGTGEHEPFGVIQEKTANIVPVMERLSLDRKMLLFLNPEFFHAIGDTLAIILCEARKDPMMHFIIDMSYKDRGRITKSFIDFFINFLNRLEIHYELVELEEQTILLNNFCLVTPSYYGLRRMQVLSEEIQNAFGDDITPTRKVFISRKPSGPIRYRTRKYYNPDDLLFPTDNRMDDDQALEEIFFNFGFEIVYPEEFETFEDQVRFFGSVDILVGITGAGLTNMLFMKPGTSVIELSVPMGIVYDLKNFEFTFHGIYKELALVRKMFYGDIPTMRLSQDVASLINNNKILRRILEA